MLPNFGPALRVLHLEYAESPPAVCSLLLRRLGESEPAGGNLEAVWPDQVLRFFRY